jgi:chromosome partitioning protein
MAWGGALSDNRISNSVALPTNLMPLRSQNTWTVTVVNPQTGVGKTTLALNLAASLFKLGHTCLLVDLDHEAHASRALGVRLKPGTHSGYTVMRGLSDFAESYMPTLSGIDLLPAHLDLLLLETPAIAATGPVRHLLDSHEAAQPYDYILLDCPSALSSRVQDALAIADEVLVPFRMDNADLLPGEVLSVLAQILTGQVMRPVANMIRDSIPLPPAAQHEHLRLNCHGWDKIHYSPKLLKHSIHGLPAVMRWPTEMPAQEFFALARRLQSPNTPSPTV